MGLTNKEYLAILNKYGNEKNDLDRLKLVVKYSRELSVISWDSKEGNTPPCNIMNKIFETVYNNINKNNTDLIKVEYNLRNNKDILYHYVIDIWVKNNMFKDYKYKLELRLDSDFNFVITCPSLLYNNYIYNLTYINGVLEDKRILLHKDINKINYEIEDLEVYIDEINLNQYRNYNGNKKEYTIDKLLKEIGVFNNYYSNAKYKNGSILYKLNHKYDKKMFEYNKEEIISKIKNRISSLEKDKEDLFNRIKYIQRELENNNDVEEYLDRVKLIVKDIDIKRNIDSNIYKALNDLDSLYESKGLFNVKYEI